MLDTVNGAESGCLCSVLIVMNINSLFCVSLSRMKLCFLATFVWIHQIPVPHYSHAKLLKIFSLHGWNFNYIIMHFYRFITQNNIHETSSLTSCCFSHIQKCILNTNTWIAIIIFGAHHASKFAITYSNSGHIGFNYTHTSLRRKGQIPF